MSRKQNSEGCYPFCPDCNLNNNSSSSKSHNDDDSHSGCPTLYSEEKQMQRCCQVNFSVENCNSSSSDLEMRKNKNAFTVKGFERNQMKEHIMAILKRARPNAPSSILNKIPALADRLETKLFCQAKSLTEYSNRFTLATRLKQVAKENPKNTLSKKPGKRQRPIFHNSSGDLAALANEKRRNITSTTTSVQFLASQGKDETQKITFHFTNHVGSPENEAEESDLEDMDDEEDSDEEEKATSVLKSLHRLLLNLIFEELTPMNKDTIMKEIVNIFRNNANLRGSLDEVVAHSIILCMDGATRPETFLLHRWDDSNVQVKDFDIHDIEIDGEENQIIQPLDTGLSSILMLCTEICGSPPVSTRLIRTILSLYKGRMVEVDRHIEWVNPQFDVRILRRCIDRLILSCPDTVPMVVQRLLKSWPEKDSAAQGLFLTQIESIIQATSKQRLMPLLECVVKRVAKCCIHGNGHLASHAISIAHKLIQLSGLRLTDEISSQNLRYLQGIRESLVNMRTLIIANNQNYYNPELKARAGT
eukprot:CAMPEP_0204864702 /NCGR_PEP_ID=MMETSP1348-20121228/4240_1 /ASSEMBLY_ACC=CAM_ASM_000700 /TAXON_ID=215587 /ORGANISM="Aplanochytrium stocchinoi, Strain GSBS06" /LENGTH=531 /DNA_ID=CAMNT_0052015395 /DNA_START=280 /DNA_END=1872 /DNA_ORIENTATION=-